MGVVETERKGQILVVRMNRPERLNALNLEMRTRLAETWAAFRRDDDLEVAIFTGTGRGFCAGEDMRESLQRGAPGGQRPEIEDPFMSGGLEKPVIDKGYIKVPESPGLGVTLNDDECKKHVKPSTEYFAPTPQWDEAQSWDDALFS